MNDHISSFCFRLSVFVALALAAGCQMKEFSSTPLYSGSEVKFTGAVEDRINLWPLAYWREPVGSVAWPLVSWGDDHLALRPVWSRYRQYGSATYDEFNLFRPIGQFDTKHHDYRLFPLFWGSDSKGENPYFCLFPALWWNREFAGVFPFFWSRGGGGGGFCAFPLFWSEWTASGSCWNTVWPIYSYASFPKSDKHSPSDQSEFWAIGYLAGWNRRGGEWNDHRFLPFYMWDRGDFYSLPYSRYDSHRRTRNRLLCGLAGYDTETSGVYRASWTFPLYYHNRPRETLITPLYGKSRDSEWLFPVYYHDASRVDTLAFSYWNHAKEGSRGWLSVPLLSGATWKTNSKERAWLTLAGLAGGSTDGDGVCDSAWLFPLFGYGAGRSFWSLPYSRTERDDSTNRIFAAGLAGLHTGGTEGGWLFPLYSKETDAGFNERFALLDAGRLPETIKVWTEVTPHQVWNRKTGSFEEVAGPEKRATSFYAFDRRTHLLLLDNDRSVCGGILHGETNYVIGASHEIGNRLLFRREVKRRVAFDVTTRERVADREEGSHSLFWPIYQHDWKRDTLKGTSKQCHNILWKLWDWEEENGDIALDVFPGFTYDTKTNGYVKTSLFWRLFRYENDPERGKKVDFLFLPVWR